MSLRCSAPAGCDAPNRGLPCLATVYRTVGTLVAHGVLHALAIEGGVSTYGLAHYPHHHAVCTQCGTIIEVPAPQLPNTLTIAVAPGNPKKIASLKDLAQPGISVVVCAPQVPCGSATQKVEQAAGVQLQTVSEESQVTDVLTKVESGEADAGLVYVTDVLGAGDKVTGVPFPEAAGAVNTYPIAVLKQSQNPELARKFADLVTGEAGQKVLAADGFAKP